MISGSSSIATKLPVSTPSLLAGACATCWVVVASVAAVFEAPAALLAAEPVAAPLDAAVASAVVDWAVDPAVAAALSDAGRPPANAVLPAVIIDPTTK